jgi:GNAT superfamily N-acetyltransferase
VIRAGTFEDIPKAAALRQRAWPDTIITVEGMRHHVESTPARADRRIVAFEEHGEILGWADVGRAYWQDDPHHGWIALAVDPEHGGRGIGSALMDAVEEHLSALAITSTRAGSLDSAPARALAEGRGFAEIGSSSRSAVDPRTVEPLPVPADVTIVPFAELDDPEPVWALDCEVSRDIPNEEFVALPLDEWTREFWRVPIVDDDASLAAFVGGELAAITMIRVDRPSGRAQNNLAGVRSAYRGRGLAMVLKSHSLARAAELGATIAITDNEERNVPMLSVNTKLGYRPFARRLEWERVTTGS